MFDSPGISACVLTHNSAAFIKECLSSLKFCDEIIVIDDDSSDQTRKITKEYGARVFKKSLHGDYASQRNFGLKIAKFEWVLFIDSDELVPIALKKEIIKKVKNVNPSVAAFDCRRDDYFLGHLLQHGPAATNYFIRLLRKNDASWTVSQPERVIANGQVLHLEQKIKHLRKENLHQYIEKVNRYSTLEARWLYENGSSTNKLQITTAPIKWFYKSFFQMKGRKDGMYGFIICSMIAIIQFFIQLKLWEYHKNEK